MTNMIETATLITLCMLYLIFFRPGTTPPLGNPLVIERTGQYHMTLAPQLNLAQPFIEAIARHLGTAQEATRNSATHGFEVHDKNVKAHGCDFYLLAITRRNGMLYFQAARPESKVSGEHWLTLSVYADEVLARFPAAQSFDAAPDAALVAAVQDVAQQNGITLRQPAP
jgi:hypothetical protein